MSKLSKCLHRTELGDAEMGYSIYRICGKPTYFIGGETYNYIDKPKPKRQLFPHSVCCYDHAPNCQYLYPLEETETINRRVMHKVGCNTTCKNKAKYMVFKYYEDDPGKYVAMLCEECFNKKSDNIRTCEECKDYYELENGEVPYHGCTRKLEFKNDDHGKVEKCSNCNNYFELYEDELPYHGCDI